jgi:hypothetical protein
METRPSVGREVPFEEFGEGLLEVMVVPAKVPVVVAVLDVDDVVLDDVAVSLSAGRMDMAAGEFKRCVVDPFVECVLVDTAGGDRSGTSQNALARCVLQWHAWGRGKPTVPSTAVEIQGKEN